MSFHKNSANYKLSQLVSVGDYFYEETSFSEYEKTMRRLNTPKNRRPDSIKDWVFECSLFTAVPANTSNEIRYLVKVRRVK